MKTTANDQRSLRERARRLVRLSIDGLVENDLDPSADPTTDEIAAARSVVALAQRCLTAPGHLQAPYDTLPFARAFVAAALNAEAEILKRRRGGN